MVFFCFFSHNFETGISDSFLLIPSLLVQKMFVWREDNLFLPGIMLSKHFIYYGNDQRTAVVQQCAEYIIIRCVCYFYIFHWHPSPFIIFYHIQKSYSIINLQGKRRSNSFLNSRFQFRLAKSNKF